MLLKQDNHIHCTPIDIRRLPKLAIISKVPKTKIETLLLREGKVHFAFRSRDISPAFASSLIDLETFPERNLAI